MSSKNRVKLDIAGCDVFVVSDDTEEYTREVGAKVDEHIRKLIEYSPNMSTTLASIFCALDYCDQAIKEKAAADNLRSQIKEYFDDASHARAEAKEAHRREEEAENEISRLRAVMGLKNFQEQQKLDEKKKD